MKGRSVFFKLFTGNLLLVLVIVAVSFAVAYTYLNSRFRHHSAAYQQETAHILTCAFENNWEAIQSRPNPQREIDALVKKMLSRYPGRLTIIADDGRVLGDSESDPLKMGNHKTPERREVLQALNGQETVEMRPSETMGQEYRYLALPITVNGQIVGALRYAMPVTAIAERRQFISRAFSWASAAGIFLTLLLGLLLSWIWYSPLDQICRAADQIAQGDLEQRVYLRGRGELADLAHALNEMRRSLRLQIGLIQSQQAELAEVVSNLGEGVIALDAHRKIVLMNPAAAKLLLAETKNFIGKKVQQVVRIAEVHELLDRLSAGTEAIASQIEIDHHGKKRFLEIRLARIPSAEESRIGTLLVVHDITELTRTAAIKAEFVANASHELRTPLATIRAAVDSLRLLEPDDHKGLEKFVGILDRHAHRLEDLVNDLLDLHRVEQSKRALSVERIALDELAMWTKNHFIPVAEEKNIALICESQSAGAAISTDRSLIQMILQNLVDNALKFTPPGGTVTVRFDGREERWRIRVTDTGCGIEPEMQPRVFERFFQVDSSRSGQPDKRGTGLGLSIVKHAAERLGTEVHLYSQVGVGTTVEINHQFHAE